MVREVVASDPGGEVGSATFDLADFANHAAHLF
jgi:hypothetical protein